MATSRQICLTVPTLRGVRLAVDNFYQDVVLTHTKIGCVSFLVLAFEPRLPFQIVRFLFYSLPKTITTWFLSCLGFDQDGVRGGSFASNYQSQRYGGYVPAQSNFSYYQSYGATTPALLLRVEERDDESSFWTLLRFGYACLAVHFLFL